MRKRLLRGLYSQGFFQLVLLFVKFAEIPLFIKFWGVRCYGEWLLIMVLPSYLALSDLGFAQATTRQLSMLVAGGDRVQALSAFQTGAVMSLVFSFCISLSMLGVIDVIINIGKFNMIMIGNNNVIMICSILIFYIVAILQKDMWFGVLQSEGRYSLGIMVFAIMDFVTFMFSAIFLFLGFRPVGIAWVITIVSWVGLGILRLLAWRIAPWAYYGFRCISRDAFNALIKPSLGLMAFPMGNFINNDAIRVLVGYVFGPVAVVIFVAHKRLARLAGMAANFSNPFQAEMSLASKQTDKFSRIAVINVQMLFWASLILAAGVFIASPYAFPVWVSGRVHLQMGLLVLLVMAVVLESLWRLALGPALSTNRHVRASVGYLLITFMGFPLAYIFAVWWNMLGIGMAIMVVNLLILIVCSIYFVKYVRISYYSILVDALLNPHRLMQMVFEKAKL